MILELYSIKDELTDYAPPLPFTDEANAKRYFHFKLNNDEFMKYNPNDYSLWYLGHFDTEKGTITEMGCELIERGYYFGNNENSVPNSTE